MKSLLYLLLLGSIQVVHAQTPDSLRIEQTTEDARISATEVKRFIRYITRADVEERTLVKVGVWPASEKSYQGYRTDQKFGIGLNYEILVEQKLSPSFSFMAGLDGVWRYNSFRVPVNSLPSPSTPPPTSYSLYILHSNITELFWKAGFRYYHGMAKRIRTGRSANNFSGNYISIQVAEPTYRFLNVTSLDPYKGSNISFRDRDLLLESPKPRLSLLYGLQRRLGKFAYADINAGPEIQFGDGFGSSLYFQLNAFIGFGW